MHGTIKLKTLTSVSVTSVNYSLLLCVANILHIKTTKYYTLNLPSRSRAVAILFQALSAAILTLYDFLLRSSLTEEV